MIALCKSMLTNEIFRILLALALALAAAGALGQGDPIFDCGRLDEIAGDGGEIFPEEREWYDQNCVEEEEEEVIFWPPLPTPTPRPPVNTCAELPADVVVSGFRAFSTQCQRLGAAGVGNASLVAMGVLDAVDVWADVASEMRVCFRRRGSLKFLDAATAPRLVSDLAAEYSDGMTCGRINRAGTVVLMQAGDSAVETAVLTSDSTPTPAKVVPTSSTICQLLTTGRLSLRAGPSVNYARILSMPHGTRLVAEARIGDWFMVNFEGQWGWASKIYLAASPGCDALDDERAIILPPIIESSAPESEQVMTDESETMPDAEEAEMAAAERQSPDECQLTAAYLLNLREGPGLDYDVLAEVPYQTRLIASAKSDDWFEVDYEGLAGWVSREYVFRWGACYALGEAELMIPSASDEPGAPEAEVMTADEETVPDAEEAEMAAPESPMPNVCQLTAVYLLNLRAGPGLDYDVLAEVPYQTRLIASAKSGDWFEVDYEGLAGWVNREYVFRWGACYALGEAELMMPSASDEPGAPEAEAAMTADEETMPDAEEAEMAAPESPMPNVCQLTAVYLLNLREGPGLDYDVLAEVPYQTRLIASAKSDDWFKVDYEGVTGWVSREYVFRWGACYALGEDDAMMPPASSEPPTSEVVEAGEMMEAGTTEMMAEARALARCNLRSGDTINLRQGAGMEYAVIAEIPNETSMNALARSGDWFMVEYLADTGWVNIDYVFRIGACG